MDISLYLKKINKFIKNGDLENIILNIHGNELYIIERAIYYEEINIL
jgi:hypothetical protein